MVLCMNKHCLKLFPLKLKVENVLYLFNIESRKESPYHSERLIQHKTCNSSMGKCVMQQQKRTYTYHLQLQYRKRLDQFKKFVIDKQKLVIFIFIFIFIFIIIIIKLLLANRDPEIFVNKNLLSLIMRSVNVIYYSKTCY